MRARSEGYSTWPVTQHLTFHVFIRATNYNLVGDGWKSQPLSDFLWKCFVANSCWYGYIIDKSAIFYSAENAHVYESGPRG